MSGQGGKGGGSATPANFNVNTAAAQGLQGAMAGTGTAMAAPLAVEQYMNPYTDQVVNQTQMDIERQRQMAMNDTAAAAQKANAFGGSRHGVAEGMTNQAFANASASALAPLRMQSYNNAFSNARADRGDRVAAAGQLGTLSNQAFNTGRTINQDLAAQGLMQQGLNQALIDAAKGDFANYANSPLASLEAPLAAIGQPSSTTTSTTNNPGLLGTLGALKYIGIL